VIAKMKRREFITLVGGAAAWPLTARAQQPERMRRIGVLAAWAADDQDNKVRLAAFQQRLQQLGWTDGRDVRFDYRFAAGNLENYRKYAAELVALAPDVILAPGTSLSYMLQATRTLPIVFPIARFVLPRQRMRFTIGTRVYGGQCQTKFCHRKIDDGDA
jgi:putative tryptophan/tyrosine transport system substrate-binding protein